MHCLVMKLYSQRVDFLILNDDPIKILKICALPAPDSLNTDGISIVVWVGMMFRSMFLGGSAVGVAAIIEPAAMSAAGIR